MKFLIPPTIVVVEFKYSLEDDLNDLTKEAINQLKIQTILNHF